MNQNLSKLVPLIQNCMLMIRTSSNYDGSHTAANIALFNKNDPNTARDGSEGWVSSVSDTNQYVVLGGENPRTFAAITLQGRGDQDQWVTTYRLRYTLDGIHWNDYRNGGVIQGCWDRNSPSVHFFDEPFRARSISIHPLTWDGAIALRMELHAIPYIQTRLVQNGRVSINDKTVLSTSNTNKSHVVPVVFDNEFPSVPKVTVGFSYLTTESGSYSKTSIEALAKNVTTKGFDCVLTIYNNSKAYWMNVDYVAILQE